MCPLPSSPSRDPKLTNILLFFILLLGAVLRLTRYPPVFVVDSARDLLMGLHIARDLELPLVGHWALGVSFPYPPYYYYFLGILSSISTDLFFIFSVFVFIQLLGIIALYQIGALLYNRKAGLLAGLFYAVSAIMVISGSMIETVFLNIPIFLFSFWSFVVFYKSQRTSYAFLTILIILVSASIHASSIPFLFLYTVVAVYRLGKENIGKIFLLIIFTFCLAVIFYLPVVRFYGLSEFLRLLFYKLRETSSNNVFLVFLLNWGKLLLLLFFSRLNSVIFFISYVLLLLSLLLRADLKKIKGLFIPIGCIGYFLLLAAVAQKDIYLHYLIIITPFVFLGVSYLLIENLKSKTLLLKVVTVSVAVVTLFLFVKGLWESVPWVSGDYRTYAKLTDLIMSDVSKRKKEMGLKKDNFYQVFVVTPEDNYKNSFLVWYFLEKKYHQKHAKVANTERDFIPLGGKEVIYLICDFRSRPSFSVRCLEEYTTSNPDKKYEGLLEQIDQNYQTHVFTILDTLP